MYTSKVAAAISSPHHHPPHFPTFLPDDLHHMDAARQRGTIQQQLVAAKYALHGGHQPRTVAHRPLIAGLPAAQHREPVGGGTWPQK